MAENEWIVRIEYADACIDKCFYLEALSNDSGEFEISTTKYREFATVFSDKMVAESYCRYLPKAIKWGGTYRFKLIPGKKDG